MKKRILALFTAVILIFTLVGCSAGDTNEENNKITIATFVGGVGDDLIHLIKHNVEDQGYVLEIIPYNDFNTPNEAVNDGEIFLNFYQHQVYLNEYNENKGTDLVMVGDSAIYTNVWGIYSNNIEDLNELEEGSKVAIYNDTSNRTICLEVLEDVGLIELNEIEGENYLLTDIKNNPMNLEIIEVDGTNTATIIDDVDFTITTGFMISESGNDPTKALKSYAFDDLGWILVSKAGNEESEKAVVIYEALTSDEIKEFLDVENEGMLKSLF